MGTTEHTLALILLKIFRTNIWTKIKIKYLVLIKQLYIDDRRLHIPPPLQGPMHTVRLAISAKLLTTKLLPHFHLFPFASLLILSCYQGFAICCCNCLSRYEQHLY